ncbi:MAG: ATP synthase F0 subunit A [Gemmatimonadales bacterium]|nr:MAG: ATP synthase F0 subunit A [Gemmatimonadales bacterium]
MTDRTADGAGVVQEATAEETFDLGAMLMGKVSDSRYLDFAGYRIDLPQWDPIQIGALAIDFSPTKNVVFMLLAALLCMITFVGVARTFVRMKPDEAPSGFANAVESLVVFFRDQVVRANIGHGSDGYTPFILTLFFFILYMNLLGLVPFGASATASLSVTAALAFVAFVVVEISGFRALGPAGYARTIFYAPPGLHPVGSAIILLIMTPVEALGKLTKPFALAIRLFANMTAGKVLILALLGLTFIFADAVAVQAGVAGSAVLTAAAITLLKVFISFLQAFIFAMLTAVFIGLIRHAH